MKEKQEMIYARLRNSIQYHEFRELHLGQCVKDPEKGGRKKSMWIIVGTKATELSRDRSQRVMFVEPKRVKQGMLMMAIAKALLRRRSL